MLVSYSSKKKSIAVFIVIFVHITLLDFILVTRKGMFFLVEENLQWQTIATHLAISLLISLSYLFIANIQWSVKRISKERD